MLKELLPPPDPADERAARLARLERKHFRLIKAHQLEQVASESGVVKPRDAQLAQDEAKRITEEHKIVLPPAESTKH